MKVNFEIKNALKQNWNSHNIMENYLSSRVNKKRKFKELLRIYYALIFSILWWSPSIHIPNLGILYHRLFWWPFELKSCTLSELSNSVWHFIYISVFCILPLEKKLFILPDPQIIFEKVQWKKRKETAPIIDIWWFKLNELLPSFWLVFQSYGKLCLDTILSSINTLRLLHLTSAPLIWSIEKKT